jgi:hypothetical protein
MKACDAVQELLAAHVLGALGESEAALVGDHLGSCEACQAAEARARMAVLMIEAPAVAPPPKVWAGIQAKIAHGRAGDDPVRTAPTAVVSVSCSFCRGGLLRPEAVYCASCLSPHHPDCFEDHGRCSVMGCGETRIVRPADLPPLEDVMDARRRYRASRRARRNWLLGGIAILGGGTLAALSGTADMAGLEAPSPVAAATPRPSASPAAPHSPAESVASASARDADHFDVSIRDATLEEVVAALGEASGAQVLLPPTLRDVLVRERSWSASSWSGVLKDLADDLDLRCETQDQGALAVLLPGDDSGQLERAGEELTRHRSWWLDSRGGVSEVMAGPGGPRRLAVAESGQTLALGVGRRLLAFKTGEPTPTAQFRLPGPVCGLAWSPSGRRLAFLVGPQRAPRLGIVEDLRGDPRWVEKGRVERAGELAWLGEEALVISHREGIDEVVFDEGEVATRPARALPWQVEQLPDGRLWIERPGASEVWRSLSATRVLSVSPEGFQVVEAGSGRAVSQRFPKLPAWGEPRTWPVRLSPNGQRLAWVHSSGSWYHVSLADDPARLREHGFTREGGGADPTGSPLHRLAWAPSGQELLLWSAGQLFFYTFPPQGPGSTSVGIDGLAPGERVADALWCGDALWLTTTSAQLRTGVVEVSPVLVEPTASRRGPRPTPTELSTSDLDLSAIWRPRTSDEPAPQLHPLPGETRPSLAPATPTVGPEATPTPETEPAPAAAESPAEPEPEPSPTAVVAEPSLEPAAPPTPAEPEPTVDLRHVEQGQRWVFAHGEGGIVEVWTVEGVGLDEVHYHRQFRVNNRPVGDEELHTWRPKTDEGARALARGAARGEERRETFRVDGLGALPCAVVRVEGVETWRALGGDEVTFPGTVRELRAGAEQRVLVQVE